MRTILPVALIDQLIGIKDFDPAAFEQVHALAEPLTSIRINPLKCNNPQQLLTALTTSVEAEKSTAGGYTAIPWCANGYYLPARPFFTFDPLLHAGQYYVQEASSMFIEQALKQTTDLSAPLNVLDLCAAPGGKSTLLQSLISKESVLISNDVIRTRATILEENIIKWGADNVIVTNNDPAHFARLENYFDVIVADAPCSGSGLFRKDAEAIAEWSENNVQLCSQRQQRILNDVWPALKQDGLLIYSTCSYSVDENETIADWIAEQFAVETVPLQLQTEWGITAVTTKRGNYAYRFWPYLVKGEGFFLAAFRKKEGDKEHYSGTPKTDLEKPDKYATGIATQWLQQNKYYELVKQKDDIIALPPVVAAALPVVQQALYIKKAGITIGRLLRDELVPDHQLAMSPLVADKVVRVSLNKEAALQYLRKQDVVIDSIAKGWALVTYNEQPLGWVKLLQNRVNNYYPKEWRIRKEG